jgi:hypothetical protein
MNFRISIWRIYPTAVNLTAAHPGCATVCQGAGSPVHYHRGDYRGRRVRGRVSGQATAGRQAGHAVSVTLFS